MTAEETIKEFLDSRNNRSWPGWHDRDFTIEKKIDLLADIVEHLLKEKHE